MNSIEITNLTEKELELLFAQKELEALTPEVEEDNSWLTGDFQSFEDFDFDAELTEEQKEINALNDKIELLTAQVKEEKEKAISAKIEANNAIIANLQKQIGTLKFTKAGRSFTNFYTGKTQFMTFTEINAAKIKNQIACIRNENKDLGTA